ncbi:hypothetical protein C5167_036118 [Papaver somniferum]|nr:hypothetical protein C5167_036118 [Papaver somniferum]
MENSPLKPRTILLNAAFEGDLERLKKSASEVDSVDGDGLATVFRNTKDEDGRCALHHAAAGGKLDVLKYLIEEIKLIDDIDVKDNSVVVIGCVGICSA